MFARNVALQLKPNSEAEFTRILEKDIIPLLRKQKGFQDEITFIVPEVDEKPLESVYGFNKRTRKPITAKRTRRY